MKNLRYWIVGAGGFGREVLSYIEADETMMQRGSVAGFIDDDPSKPMPSDLKLPITTTIGDFWPEKEDRVIIAIGDPGIRHRIYDVLKKRHTQFLTIIHPTATVGPRIQIGEGCVICPKTVLTCDIQIGVCAIINCQSTIGHDATVGNFVTISGHCDITGGVSIDDLVFLGSHASITPYRKVGRRAHVGPSASVIQDVPDEIKVYGVPARPF